MLSACQRCVTSLLRHLFQTLATAGKHLCPVSGAGQVPGPVCSALQRALEPSRAPPSSLPRLLQLWGSAGTPGWAEGNVHASCSALIFCCPGLPASGRTARKMTQKMLLPPFCPCAAPEWMGSVPKTAAASPRLKGKGMSSAPPALGAPVPLQGTPRAGRDHQHPCP